MSIKLTIGILTIPTRKKKLAELMKVLKPQLTNEVELIVVPDNFTRSVSDKRQEILDNAQGEYICFIDDDDLVSEDYIAQLLPHLDGENHYVGFMVAFYEDGARKPKVKHSLQYTGWSQDENQYYRDISHLNPIRVDLARQATFRKEYGEDADFSSQLRGILTKEFFIDKELYIYRHSSIDNFENNKETKGKIYE